MEYTGFTRNEIDVIRKLSADLVDKIAPEEASLFDDFFSEYLKERAKKSDQGFRGVVEKDLAFSPDIMQEVLTPTVISAVIVGVFKLVELLAAKRREQQGGASLDDINFQGIERELFKILRSWRVGHSRAERISQEFVSCVAQDPNVVLKVMK